MQCGSFETNLISFFLCIIKANISKTFNHIINLNMKRNKWVKHSHYFGFLWTLWRKSISWTCCCMFIAFCLKLIIIEYFCKHPNLGQSLPICMFMVDGMNLVLPCNPHCMFVYLCVHEFRISIILPLAAATPLSVQLFRLFPLHQKLLWGTNPIFEYCETIWICSLQIVEFLYWQYLLYGQIEFEILSD